MKLKLFSIIFILLLAFNCFAQDVTLEWDANTESDLIGYNVYKAQSNDGPWGKINTNIVTDTTYIINFTEQEESTYYFYVTALDSYNESSPSNIVSTRVDNIAPSAPGTLRLSINVTINLGSN